MYMSPEVIRNDKRGRHGAMDIWSLGCVILECATGKKPWSNLDNEWSVPFAIRFYFPIYMNMYTTRAIMFHIGVGTQHPPLPEPGQLSELGINFIKQCLTIDPLKRPSATELMDHPWMVEFREVLLSYEEAELATSSSGHIPTEASFENASVASRVAIIQEKEGDHIRLLEASPITPSEDPSELSTPA